MRPAGKFNSLRNAIHPPYYDGGLEVESRAQNGELFRYLEGEFATW